MLPRKIFAAALIGLFACFCAAEERVLVLLDDHSIAYTHSIFFNSLRERGFKLDFYTADNSGLSLTRYGKYLYEHLLIFSPSVTEFGGSLNVRAIANFIDGGGNVLVAASSSVDEPLRSLASECGLEFDETKTSVIDHVNYDTADNGSHTRLVVEPDRVISNSLIAGPKLTAPLLYRGVGLAIDPANSLVTGVVHGASTTYSYFRDEKIKEYPYIVGKKTVLVAAVQARNNARVVFSGSLDLFSDEFLTSAVQSARDGAKRFDQSGNKDFAVALSNWAFAQTGRLRFSNVTHRRVVDAESPPFYTIEDDVIFSIYIEEKFNGEWRPFNGKGVQLEFHRIDPFVRLELEGVDGLYSLRFKLPDVYGVFRFQVDFRHLGYTYLYSGTQVSVRPKTHRQYERFILSAFPYYASAFSMMIGLVLFSAVFVFHQEKEKSD